MVPPGYRIGLSVRGKDYEYDGTDAALPHAAYPMKGVGPFTHTDPRDRPPEIFGGANTLHFGADHGAVRAASDHSAEVAHGSAPRIVGLGRWGRSLVNSVQGKSDDIRFVLAHTRTRASAEEFCREKGVRLVDRYDEILADPDIDAVVLATPHSQHEQQILAAAQAGKHIHVEKPITLDRPSADAAVAAARKAGVVLAVGYCRRFHPSVVEIRSRLQGRAARRGRLHGGAAHHQHRPVHPAGQLARHPRGGAGRRPDRGRACIRSTT